MLYGEYDYGSVMHYSRCGFHSNGWETITPIVSLPCIWVIKNIRWPLYTIMDDFSSQDPTATIGQRIGMSQMDVEKLIRFYGC